MNTTFSFFIKEGKEKKACMLTNNQCNNHCPSRENIKGGNDHASNEVVKAIGVRTSVDASNNSNNDDEDLLGGLVTA